MKKKQVYTLPAGYFEKQMKKTDDPDEQEKLQQRIDRSNERRDEADFVGKFHGQDVSEYRLSHSASLLAQLRKRGRIVGTCRQHTFFCCDLLRSLGIATLQFGVEPAGHDKINHVWPACYYPKDRCWRSYQAGRSDDLSWHFYVSRVPVYAYAAEAPRIFMTDSYDGPRQMPLVMSSVLKGAQVKETVQRGLPADAVRAWLLTPGFP